jgi:hypothetical protein
MVGLDSQDHQDRQVEVILHTMVLAILVDLQILRTHLHMGVEDKEDCHSSNTKEYFQTLLVMAIGVNMNISKRKWPLPLTYTDGTLRLSVSSCIWS